MWRWHSCLDGLQSDSMMQRNTICVLFLTLTCLCQAQDVEPIIKMQWDQGSPYNSFFPADSTGKKPLAGCVPIAMAQVIYSLDDSHDSLKLIYECAKSVNTTFGGSYTSSRGSTVLPAMKKVFHCSKYMNCVYQNDYYGEDGRLAWQRLIFNEIRQGRPILASGKKNASGGGGHLFIIDGLRDTLVHVNFGWGGKGNGYYPLDDLRGYHYNMWLFTDIASEDYVPVMDTLCVTVPGTLCDVLTERSKWSIRHLKIEGNINADDIKTLRAFARQSLRTLDLSAARIAALPDSAFADCSDLVMVSLPDDLESTGKYTFLHCISLNSVHLPASLKVIGVGAFQRCIGLFDINIPHGLTNIQNQAFYGCSILTSIGFPSTLQTIGMRAFKGCEQLRRLVLPKSVRSFGVGALDDCPNVKVSIEPGNPYLVIKDGAVVNKR